MGRPSPMNFPGPTGPPGTKRARGPVPGPPAQPAGEHGRARSLSGLVGLGPGQAARLDIYRKDPNTIYLFLSTLGKRLRKG
jgi:hypothetical protein